MSISQAVETNQVAKKLKYTIYWTYATNILCTLIISGSIYLALFKYANRVYALNYGSPHLSQSHDGRIHSSYEVENFAKMFLKLMYSHDANTFQKRVSTALQYVSKSDGQGIVDDFGKQKLLEQYIRSGVGIRMEVDSMKINMEKIPYEGMAYSRQIVFNGSREVVVPFGLKFKVGMLPRSSQNPFGLQIRDMGVFKYDFNYSSDKKADLLAPSEYEKTLMPIEENMDELTDTKVQKAKENENKKKNAP